MKQIKIFGSQEVTFASYYNKKFTLSTKREKTINGCYISSSREVRNHSNKKLVRGCNSRIYTYSNPSVLSRIFEKQQLSNKLVNNNLSLDFIKNDRPIMEVCDFVKFGINEVNKNNNSHKNRRLSENKKHFPKGTNIKKIISYCITRGTRVIKVIKI